MSSDEGLASFPSVKETTLEDEDLFKRFSQIPRSVVHQVLDIVSASAF